jgi:hypothetical protein
MIETVEKHKQEIEKLEQFVKDQDASKGTEMYASMSQVDGKIKAVLEKLKNDN